MSYLGFPRIHIAGTFYSNPGNLNNATSNFKKAADDEPLEYDTGRYNNPDGVAQFYFCDCEVTQVIGTTGAPNTSDPLIGAAVDTVNSWDAQTDALGNSYILAKISDLDPDMQFRSELYGLRIFVKSADGFGFNGTIDVPQLRDLFFGRGDGGIAGLQVACGTWHQRIKVEEWLIPAAGQCEVLDLLSANGANELDIKLSVDMFQTEPSQQFTKGDRYCYGRLMATIGSVAPDSPTQIVPGRRLYSTNCFANMSTQSSAILTREKAEAAAATATQQATQTPPFWNNTDTRIVTANNTDYLLLDMGTTTPLNSNSNGTFDIGQSLTLGYLNSSDEFIPFIQQGYTANNNLVSVTEQLQDYVDIPGAANYRDSAYLKNAGVVQVALTTEESTVIASSRLCIQSNDITVLKENKDGIYINFEAASCRMQPNQTLHQAAESVTLVGYRYGQPLDATTLSSLDLRFTPQLVTYDSKGNALENPVDTDIFSVTDDITPLPGLPGQFAMSIITGPAQSLANNPYRQPLDSLMCFVKATASELLIGENPFSPIPLYIPAISLLFWQDNWVTETPTWEKDIGPILHIYAKLFPGMTGRMDIGDETTVKANATGILSRFNKEILDPAFMPVVRDMSPATRAMMSVWLANQINADQ